MKKVFVLSPGEDWIVDRFVKEWYEDNGDISVRTPKEADVVWLFSEWCYRHIDRRILQSKKVITTIHHVVPEKFDSRASAEFFDRDSVTDVYHVPNKYTEQFVKSLSKKPVVLIPYWANQKIWRRTSDKNSLRKKYNIPVDSFVIGSFQRDTEGSDLKSPKLEKGPDLLADFIIKFKQEYEHRDELKSSIDAQRSVHVVLAGWRRQYIMGRLSSANVPYTYIERPPHNTINELYQTLDLYPVASRAEGGPQSLIECGLLGIPAISRAVGMADQVLTPKAINDNILEASPEIPNIEVLKLPLGYRHYRELIESI